MNVQSMFEARAESSSFYAQIDKKTLQVSLSAFRKILHNGSPIKTYQPNLLYYSMYADFRMHPLKQSVKGAR